MPDPDTDASRMVLLSVHHELVTGTGAPGVTLGLRDALERSGNHVRLASFADLPGRWPHVAKAPVFPAHCMSVALRTRPRVWDASTGDAWMWGAAAGRRRTALVVRSHGLEHLVHRDLLHEADAGRQRLSWKYPLYWGGPNLWQVSASLRAADVCLMLSEREAEHAVEHLGVAADRIMLGRNAIADRLLERPASGPRRGGFGIAWIGSWIPMKGTDAAIGASTDALLQVPDAHVSFLGVGPAGVHLRDAFPSALRPRIAVVERFEPAALPALLDGHHVAFASSLNEGFGIGLLEMMACGLAPVATMTAGASRLITNGVDGLLTPLRDAPAMAAAILRLHHDDALRVRLAAQAQRRARSFGWDAMLETTQDAHELAVARARARRARD